MKTFIFSLAIAFAAGTIIVSCEKSSPVKQENAPIKVNIRLAAIDSVSEARTEDKILTVNVK